VRLNAKPKHEHTAAGVLDPLGTIQEKTEMISQVETFRSIDWLRITVRVILIVALCATIVVLITELINGKVNAEFYLSVYAMMYGLFPSFIILIGIALRQKIKQKPIWPFIKIEVLLWLITLLTLCAPLVFIR
jgi:hypothetical protein